jgi:hypothetical protein
MHVVNECHTLKVDLLSSSDNAAHTIYNNIKPPVSGIRARRLDIPQQKEESGPSLAGSIRMRKRRIDHHLHERRPRGPPVAVTGHLAL